MIRTAIINTKTGIVELVLMLSEVVNPPDGFDESYLAVASDQVNIGWLWDGKKLATPPVTIIPLTSILSQDLMVQFTADDAAKIQTAVAGNAQFWLLWSAMQAQKDPMEITNDRFLMGWAALMQVLGASRMAAIATALNVTVG